MTGFTRTAAFERFDDHRSLVLRWQPSAPARAQAVFFPAFGDEMNQSRRMVRLAAESLAARGIAGCVFDLLGTGDSSADFSEATIEAWQSDCRQLLERLAGRPPVPLVLIGCRLGVALASQASQTLRSPAATLIGWAPLLQGKQQLSGMLRADKMARMSRPQIAGEDPKTCWAEGRIAMLGGYPVSAVLATQLESFDASAAPRAARASLFELRAAVGDIALQPSDALRRRADDWTAQGTPTEALAFTGPGFWNVADLVDVPALIEA
ncbi:MAG TPA: alpha/beta hydrolase, partial [Burkholderiaceae bacterium]|nr:alpha/beta hydrolase [Burkholderiaceae bacterium]